VRLVVDTNVFVSAALIQASWPAILVQWVEVFGGLLKTRATEQELFDVLARPRLLEKVGPLHAIRLRSLFATAELVTITESVAECRDPKDDKFLELAVNGKADVIVSGDLDLLTLGSCRGIPIMTPAVFGRTRAG
jgi:putative PIN family toxin of toxin-antitoxin system